MNIQTIKAAIIELQAKNAERYNKEMFDEIDIGPTVDCHGRLHAPVDNYLWKDGLYYLAGQYMPDPWAEKFDMFDYAKGTLTYKVKVVSSLVEELQSFLAGSAGKAWVENNVSVCYFYASVTKSQYKLLSDMIPQESYKKIVLVSEHGNPDNQKTWKFSSKRAWNKCVTLNMDFDFIAPGVELKFDDKHVPYSDFDKKEVRYMYFKPELLTE